MTETLHLISEHGVLISNFFLIAVSAWLAHVTAVVARHDAQALGKQARDNNRTILSIVRAFLSRGSTAPNTSGDSEDSGKRSA